MSADRSGGPAGPGFDVGGQLAQLALHARRLRRRLIDAALASGIRDATNLAWKPAAVLRGAASLALLDTYDTERRDHVKAMTNVLVTMGRILAPKRKVTGVLRDIAAACGVPERRTRC